MPSTAVAPVLPETSATDDQIEGGRMDEPEFTRHARTQMRRRGVSQDQVLVVLASYHTRQPAPTRPPAPEADILVGAVGGRALKVYVERGSNPPLLKTVAWGDE